MSSTAHLLLGERMLGFDDPNHVFAVMIQLGSMLAIAWLYRAKIVTVVMALPSDPGARRFTAAVAVAVVPALVAGVLFSGFVKSVLYESPAVFATTFVVGGVVMLVVERRRRAPTVLDADRTSLGRALGVGMCQVLAMVPGVSRSGATIVGGMMMGLDRAAAAEFSFFVAMPTMAAAFAHDLVEVRGSLGSGMAAEIAIGFVAAFVASLVVVRPFVGFVRRAGFAPFAWYRIGFGLLVFGALAAGWR